MVTGQEQYYWERAGYFIRRQLLDDEGLVAWRQFVSDVRVGESGRVKEPKSIAVVRELVQNLLGPEMLTANRTDVPLGPQWTRGNVRGVPLPLTASHGELARSHKCVTVCIALDRDETLRIVPGSHFETLPPENAAALGRPPTGSIMGEITARLCKGDAVLFSPALLRRLETSEQLACPLELFDYYI